MTDLGLEPKVAVRPRRGRGRRPMADVRDDVLNAGARILLSEGMAGFTIERVAAEAGASKTTIHKRWPSKGALAFDCYVHATQAELEFPDTGDIAADLRTQLRAFVHLITASGAGRVISELIGHAQTDRELAAAMRESFTGLRHQMAVDALERARARGQIREEVEPAAAADQLWGACYHRLLVTGYPISEAFAENLLANLLGGIRPPDSRAGSPPRTSAP